MQEHRECYILGLAKKVLTFFHKHEKPEQTFWPNG